MATLPLTTAAVHAPGLDIPVTTLGVGNPAQWQSLADSYTQNIRKRFYMYNARRPASGSFATEDDGVALRELVWGQYKKHINRWFFWESTYYNNNQGGKPQHHGGKNNNGGKPFQKNNGGNNNHKNGGNKKNFNKK